MAEWGALLRRCPGQPDRGFKSLPLRQHVVRSRAVAMAPLLCATMVVGAFLSVATPVAAASCTKFHTAKPNDSWSRLAARFGVQLKPLLKLNAANVNTPIFIGDKICVSTQEVVEPPTETFTRKQSTAIIREVWPDEFEETALFIARRESNLVHSVVGGSNDCCVGLFQIYWSVHKSWLTANGVSGPAQLLNPRTNAEAALALFRRNGNSWRPWWTSSWRP